MKTALDTNILSALWSREPLASQISTRLKDLQIQGALTLCGPVYIELCANPNVMPAFLDNFLAETGVAVEFTLDEDVWRAAAKAFALYADRRRRSGGGSPKRVPADFLVASHALLRADSLLTLDSDLYRLDFPGLTLLGL